MIFEYVLLFGIVIMSIVFHEVAHGWVALWSGDPTAKRSGRLTLNPLKHIDPIGMILVPVVLSLFNFPPFGWAKPVPVNFYNLRNPKRDMVLVAAAGPGTNVLLAVLAAGIFRSGIIPLNFEDPFYTVVGINLVLAVFNLLPIPPLDGSKIVMGMLPNHFAYQYAKWERFGIIIVLILAKFGLLEFIVTIAKSLARLMGINLT